MMGSIRGRLLLGTAAAAATVLSVAGGALYALVRASMRTDFDASLESKARAMAMLVEQDEGRIEFELGPDLLPEFERRERPEYFQLRHADGRVLRRSRSLGNVDLPLVNPVLPASAFRDVPLPDGRPGRLVATSFQPRAGNEDGQDHRARSEATGGLTLVLARDTIDVDAMLARLRWLLLGVGVGAVALAGAVLLWVVQRGLRPLRSLAERIAEIDESDLSSPIELTAAPAELRPVVARLNEMLRRIGESFARERTLTADVAHELRTPLAGLRASLEVAASRPRSSNEYRAALSDGLAIAAQMQSLIENLLTLARLEANQVEVTFEPLDLVALLHQCWAPFAARAVCRRLEVRWDVPPAVALDADHAKLQLVLTNLFDNAVTHVDETGRIEVRVDVRDGVVSLEIANTGSRLSAEQVTHVFERFWRGDPARRDAGIRCGLGLALVRRLVEAIGGTVSATPGDKGVFRVIVSIPVAHEAITGKE